jgi:hypothetical protein
LGTVPSLSVQEVRAAIEAAESRFASLARLKRKRSLAADTPLVRPVPGQPGGLGRHSFSKFFLPIDARCGNIQNIL